MTTRLKALLAAVALASGVLVLPGAPTATAADACVKPFAVTRPAEVSETPSGSIGEIGMLPPAPGQPAWDGADRVNAALYDSATGNIVVGGVVPSYIWNGQTYPRNNLASFNAVTGAPTALAPVIDGEVLSVALSCTGQYLYVGGDFTHVDGVARNNLAKIELATGALTAWDPNPNGAVRHIEIMRGHLVVTGDFTSVGGAARTNLASLGQTGAGAADSWLDLTLAGNDPRGSMKVLELGANRAGTYAVGIGNFNTVDGYNRRRMFMVRLADTGVSVTRWRTPMTASNGDSNSGTDCSAKYSAPERDVAWSPGGGNFFTASTGGAHARSLCDSLSRWSGTDVANSDVRPVRQQFTGGDTLSAVACSSDLCYTSGHNRWADNPPRYGVTVDPCDPADPDRGAGTAGYGCKGPGAVDRPGIMQVRVSSMAATAWNPGRSRQRANDNVMLMTPQGLFLGTDGDTAAGQPHNDIVLWPYL